MLMNLHFWVLSLDRDYGPFLFTSLFSSQMGVCFLIKFWQEIIIIIIIIIIIMMRISKN
jgi:hypothetical protein